MELKFIFSYNMKTMSALICVLISLLNFSESYKPVVLLHGVLTGNASMEVMAERIKTLHPGTIIYNSNRFSGWSSIESMWHQVTEFGNDLMNISKAHPKGVHYLGYSQGGLIARVILETFPDHNVHNFISLSSPQAGQFGTDFLHLFFPDLVCKTAYELFYSRLGQHISVGNYWNDPHHQSLYYSYNNFLPYVNNELLSNHSLSFKSGLTKLKKMVLVGGPDDGIITPWQSSQFGYYDTNETVIEMKQRDIYIKDWIGLKTLDKKKKLHLITVSNITHFAWHLNMTFIDNYIVPLFD